MANTSLVNIRLLSIASLGLLAAGLLLRPAEAGAEGAALVTGILGTGAIATAVLLAFIAWRATSRAGSSIDWRTRSLGRAPAFVLMAVTLAALMVRIARLVGLA